MARYQYKAMDSNGTQKAAEIAASSESDAMEQLATQGMSVLELTVIEGGGEGDDALSPGSVDISKIDEKVPLDIILTFYEQISFLIVSGIPIYLAVKMIIDNFKEPKLIGILKQVVFDLSEGVLFSQSLQRFPKAFPRLHTQLIEVGERTGKMDMVLEQVADLVKEQQNVRATLIKAMSYPAFLSVMAFTLVFAMIALVFPQFNEIFVSFKVKLPALTAFFMGIGVYLRENMVGFFMSLGGIGFLVYWFFTSKSNADTRDKMMLSLPLLKEIYVSMFMSLFGKNMGSLLKSGIPILEALSICRNTIGGGAGSRHEAITQLIIATKEGEPLSTVMQRNPRLFPELVWQLTAVGEQSGNMGVMMDNIFTFYKKNYTQLLEKVGAVLRPAMMFFAAGLIAMVAASLFIPLFSLGSSMRH